MGNLSWPDILTFPATSIFSDGIFVPIPILPSVLIERTSVKSVGNTLGDPLGHEVDIIRKSPAPAVSCPMTNPVIETPDVCPINESPLVSSVKMEFIVK